MTTAIDTNVFVALWDVDKGVTSAARTALETAFQRGNLTVAAPVFAIYRMGDCQDKAYSETQLEQK